MRFGGLFADLRGDPSPYHTASTTSANWEPFQTVTVHLDTSGTSVSFVKPGTALRQDDPRRNNGLGRFELKAVRFFVLTVQDYDIVLNSTFIHLSTLCLNPSNKNTVL